jgi:DNA-binding response OmpR family regulator
LKGKILIADDEANIRDFVAINLEYNDYAVVTAGDGREALRIFEENENNFDLALLDIMLPEMDGFELCQAILAKNSKIGIIFLTAKTNEMDKVKGLLTGADDYITKPFSPSELMARVEAVMRRVRRSDNTNSDSPLHSGDFSLNLRSRTLYIKNERIYLTNIELQLMEYFLQNRNKTLTRHDILQNVWGDDDSGDLKIVDVNVRRLRLKIEENPSSPKNIITMWGVGYKWLENAE